MQLTFAFNVVNIVPAFHKGELPGEGKVLLLPLQRRHLLGKKIR